MIASLLRLFRPRVGLLAVVAALVGWLLRRPGFESWPGLVACLGGVFLLAAGCSALNQIQERRRDALMGRTASRPLPSGRMTPLQVLGAAMACLSFAAALFILTDRPVALLALAGVVLVLYNGLYTPLKPLTPFCLLLGGAAGALPPVFGWVAAGGNALDFRILALAAVIYLWQTPHFWLFALKHGAEYRAAGFPVPRPLVRSRPRPAFLVWTACYGLAILMAPVFCLGRADAAALLPALAAAALAFCGGARLERSGLGFGLVNASLLVFLAGLAAGAVLRPVI